MSIADAISLMVTQTIEEIGASNTSIIVMIGVHLFGVGKWINTKFQNIKKKVRGR